MIGELVIGNMFFKSEADWIEQLSVLLFSSVQVQIQPPTDHHPPPTQTLIVKRNNWGTCNSYYFDKLYFLHSQFCRAEGLCQHAAIKLRMEVIPR
jgi:hypothetical protein